jgi:hypothetical protein
MRAMTRLGYDNTAMARGGTNRSNTGPVANEYFAHWRADPAKTSADAFLEAHTSEVKEAVGRPR